VLLDARYMVSIVGGLYGYIDPERALRMLKRHLVPLEKAFDATGQRTRSVIGQGHDLRSLPGCIRS